MVKRVAIVGIVCVSLMLLLADGAFAAAKADKKSDANWKRHISEDIRFTGAEEDLNLAPMQKYPAYSSKGPLTTCDDILPQMPDANVIQHDQIGHTWYDFQKNGSMGRMISVTPGGYRHFSWMFTDGPYSAQFPRYVDANCKNPAGQYVGQVHVHGGAARNAGYSCQTQFSNGTSLVGYHRAAGQIGDPVTNSMLSTEDAMCSGQFNRHWDIPDSILNEPSGQNGSWPKAEVKYDAGTGKDYIHVVMTESNLTGGAPVMVAYERCYLDTDPNYMVCQAYVSGATQSYTLYRNTNYSDPSNLVAHFDTSCGITPVVAVSPVSERVAVAYLAPACESGEPCSYLSDVAYIESMTNGDDWVDGTAYPPPVFKITDYGCGYPEDERAYHDVSACYDYNDSLHVVYRTVGFPEPEFLQPGISRLYHWSKATGAGLITTAIWGGTDAGAHNANIAKMSISAKDPIYHPGGDPDSVFLFCIWTQFDTTTPQDNSDAAFTNGEIYGTGSNDGGFTWGNIWNLTQTRTPDCTAGNCVSEHWSSLAANMHDGDLHIQYICDKHPGSAIGGQDPGSIWLDNPMYYLHLGQWDVGARCEGAYTQEDPGSFWRPAVKVAPGGSRTLEMRLENIGNLPLHYTAIPTSDPAGCLLNQYDGDLQPREFVNLTFLVDGSGACDGKFIQGTINLSYCGETTPIPVHAVVADDYYECPVDPETFDTVETSALRLYVNANSLEWMSDLSSWPDTVHDVFFQGGPFVATSMDQGNVKAVGRWYGENDWRAGVRDKLYYDQCMEGDTVCHILYTKDIFIHYPPTPPYIYHCYWWWWEWSKIVKVCQVDNYVFAIKYVTVKRHDPPTWWPEGDPPQGPYTGHEDTYIGMMMDIDCPFDTLGTENARNRAGYDAVNEIAWQQGYDYTGAHPDYNNYYAGMAFAAIDGDVNAYAPFASHNIKNNMYLYPQSPWGWLEEDLYTIASTPGVSIQDVDSLVDRSQVMTAVHIPGENNPLAEASFVVVEAATRNGLAELQSIVGIARDIVKRQAAAYGFPPQCGDVGPGGVGDGFVNLGDAVYILNYLFKNFPAPKCPLARADATGNGVVDLGDAVYLLNYLFKNFPPPHCPGIPF